MKYIFTITSALLLNVIAIAQAPRKVVADKIVGIVGDKIIRQSDVYNDIQDRQRHNEHVPGGAACYIMEQILTMKLLVLQAEKDSIVVTNDELEAVLENQIRGFIRKYGSKEMLEKIAGRSVYQIKEDFRHTFKDRILAERMRDKIVDGARITPQEVKEYFDKIPKDSLPLYESEVEIGEILVYPKASRDLDKLANEELNEYKQQIESGKQHFETLASLYSDDPAATENAGQYTINRTDKTVNASFMDDVFINNAFRLKEKQLSPVFKSKDGYHIILMESRAGDDAVVRHILRIPKITDAEISEAINKLDSVRSKLITGTLTFGEAAVKYSEDPYAQHTAGMMHGPNGTHLTIHQLDRNLVLSLKDLKPGGFSKPFPFTDENGKKGVHILYLRSRSAPHRENLKDDYDRLAQRALEIKKQQVLQKWIAVNIPAFYIMIDDGFKKCRELGNWMIQSTARQ
jgi:peptidyl-prolyl cis-trans isomerase SurA